MARRQKRSNMEDLARQRKSTTSTSVFDAHLICKYSFDNVAYYRISTLSRLRE